MKLELQINNNTVKDPQPLATSGIHITPPIDESYWTVRVPVSETQAIVAFPKFMTMGVGFQHEEDWNTNLPYTEKAESIFRHIKHNKGDDSIPDERCIKAIKMIQEHLKTASA